MAQSVGHLARVSFAGLVACYDVIRSHFDGLAEQDNKGVKMVEKHKSAFGALSVR
jgi:hypothetical protein